MALSSSLISQFAKATVKKEKTPTETTVNGTVRISDGKYYVKLDGSDLLTPVGTTTSVKDNDRVTVLIKNHTATITGNTSDPSASSNTVKQQGTKISEFEIVVADKVSVEELDAQIARINELVADNVTIKGSLTAAEANINELTAKNVTITGTLNANSASIKTLETEKLDAKHAEITYATIANLEATNADIYNLNATYGNFADLTTKRLDAAEATIGTLDVTYATIDNLNAATARIGILETSYLTADSAVIKNLQTDVADIDTLIFGSAGGSVIQSSFSNAVVAQIGTAQIKSAMIESIAADKITSGDIITNNVRVKSEDGSLLISDETIQISDTARVRVQIGKDAAGDYSINIWDADGKLMFSEGGITDSAIKEAIIRNDMVTSDANISASKLDIDSLFTEINGSSNTIKSSKVYLDEEKQTLDIAFTSITSDVENLDDEVTSQGTSITVIQGQINNKIWQTDINNAVGEVDAKTDNLTTQYSELNQELDSISATVSTHTTQIANKADGTTVTTLTNKVSEIELDLDGFKSTVSRTYATKTELSDQISIVNSSIKQNADAIELKVSSSDFNTYKTKVTTDIATAKSQATSDANSYTDGEISEVNAEITNVKSTVASHTTSLNSITSRVETTETNITALQTNFHNLSIGSVNLYRNSADFSGDLWVNLAGWNSTNLTDGYGNKVYKRSDPWNGIYQKVSVKAGETVTLSATLRTDAGIKDAIFYVTEYNDAGTTLIGANVKRYETIGTTETRVYATYTVQNDCKLSFRIENSISGSDDTLYISSLKLERGNKNTDWSPSPEDADSEITSIKNTVATHTTSINSITSRVTSTEQNITTINGEISSLETRMNAAELKITDDAIISTVSGTYATKTELTVTDTKATTANNYVTNASNNYGYQYRYDIIINGDYNTYYPVVFRGGNQNVKRTLFVMRSYNEQAPSEWAGHPTVYGIALSLKIKCNFGGWGGANYGWVVEELEEMYGNLFASAKWNMDYMAFEIFLRGGGDHGALYHIYSDQKLEVDYMNGTSPQVYYNQEQIGYSGDFKWYASAPRTLTDAIKTEINDHKFASEGDLTKAETRITQTENKINLQASDISALGTRVSALEVTSESITGRVTSAEGDISTLQQTASGLSVSLTNLSNDLSNNYTKKTLPDTRTDNQTPLWYIQNYPQQCITEFKQSSVIGLSGETYCSLETIVPWPNSSGGYPKQIATVGNKQYWRVGTGDSTWGSWTDATTTATNFMSYDSTNGLLVGNKTNGSWSGSRAQILPNAFNILDASGEIQSSFGATEIYLAKNGRDAVIDLCGGTAKMYNNYSTHTQYNRLTIESEDELSLNTTGAASVYAYATKNGATSCASLDLHVVNRWESDNSTLDEPSFILNAWYQETADAYGWNSVIYGDSFGIEMVYSYPEEENKDSLRIWLSSYMNAIEMTGKVTTSDSLTTGGGVLTNGKTGPSDGNIGAVLTHTGNLHLQASNTPAISFYTSGETSHSAQIYVNSSDQMRFNSAESYYFDEDIYCAYSLRIGTKTDSWSDTNAVVQTYWADGSIHNLAERSSGGLISAFGWAGSSSYATVTKIRGRTCQYQNSSGTTTLSDERLKKDFIDLDRYDGFFDSLEPCGFKMKTGNSGRYHIGFKAQQVEEALFNNDLTSQDFAGYIKMDYTPDDDDPERTAIYEAAGIKKGDVELGLIYTELTGLNTWQIQKLKERVAELERIVKTLTN